MAKAKRFSNPRRLNPTTQVVEERPYDEGYGPRSPRWSRRDVREWEEDPALAAVDLIISAPLQAAANVVSYNLLRAKLEQMGVRGLELRRVLKEIDKLTAAGDWIISDAMAKSDGLYRRMVREARERSLASREDVTPM